MSRKLFPLLIFTFLIFISCNSSKKITTTTQAPQAAKEFRAAWVATVANINWPSKPGLAVDSQKLEAIKLLDFLQKNQHDEKNIF